MKNILILLAAVAMLVVGLLWWHTPQRQSTHLPGKIAGSTELEPSSPTTVATQPMDLSRPVNITPEIWARALSIRTLALGQNHNIEFYARVVDQHGVGIVGARLKLDLSYVDESLFRSANFIHMQMGEEIKTKQIELISDPNGVIEVSKEKGTGLRLADLICPGYFWQMPEISGIDYRERRPRAGSVELEAAFDKNQRYNLIMWRKGETERLMNKIGRAHV